VFEEEDGVQQAHAETDPKPGKEAEDDHHDNSDDPGLLCDPSFIDPEVQGGAPPRSYASSPEFGSPIGPWPPHDPTVMAGSGLILHPVRRSGAAELSRSEPHDMNRLASSVHHATRAIRPVQHVSAW